jgi:hypothetical protein
LLGVLLPLASGLVTDAALSRLAKRPVIQAAQQAAIRQQADQFTPFIRQLVQRQALPARAMAQWRQWQLLPIPFKASQPLKGFLPVRLLAEHATKAKPVLTSIYLPSKPITAAQLALSMMTAATIAEWQQMGHHFKASQSSGLTTG